jgi:hypothetical protein
MPAMTATSLYLNRDHGTNIQFFGTKRVVRAGTKRDLLTSFTNELWRGALNLSSPPSCAKCACGRGDVVSQQAGLDGEGLRIPVE